MYLEYAEQIYAYYWEYMKCLKSWISQQFRNQNNQEYFRWLIKMGSFEQTNWNKKISHANVALHAIFEAAQEGVMQINNCIFSDILSLPVSLCYIAVWACYNAWLFYSRSVFGPVF
jgi:hypothetical protein